MSKVKLRNDLIVGILLVILVFSIGSSNVSFVQADPGGTGKYLTIIFDLPQDASQADFSVTATKLNSGQYWIYTPPSQEWKLGAGNVSLQASYPEDYTLVSWKLWGDNPVTIEDENPIVIKSEKYAKITVSFALKEVTLSVNIAGMGNGAVNDGVENHVNSYVKQYNYGASVTLTAIPYLNSTFDGWGGDLNSYFNPETITMEEDLTLTATFGLKTYTLAISTSGEGLVIANPTKDVYYWGEEVLLTFSPGYNYHLSSVNDNGFFADLVATDFTYSLHITFYEDHVVTANFDADGIAMVPEGNNVTVFLSSRASLTFTTVNQLGIALGTDLTGLFSDEFLIWAISTNVIISQDNSVLIVLRYNETILDILGVNEEEITGLWRSDFIGDVNGDGIVNGQDVSIVANANPSVPGDPTWNPFLDLTGDGLINDEDVNLVNDHIGDSLNDASWTLLDGIGEDGSIRVDRDLNLIFGVTDHFSIFRGR